MAVEGGISTDDDTPKTRFIRYLYVGKEYPVYHSGTWANQNHFVLEIVPSIEELAADAETELFPIQKIKVIYESGSVPRPETIVFALAACVRQQKSEKLRQAAYTFIAEQCKDVEHFMQFVSFASRLSKQMEIPKHGYGHGWRNAVNKWYLSKAAKDLAECVTRCKSRHGWSHKDIIKLSHPLTKGSPPDVQAIFKYIVFGTEKMRLEFGNESKAKEVVEVIENSEDFRHCEDPVRAAGLIRTSRYTIDHCNAKLLKSADVWEALVETMDLSKVLQNLQTINNAGLLTSSSQVMEKIITALADKELILKSKIRPATLVMVAKTYQDPESVPMSSKRRAGRKYKTKQRTNQQPNRKLVDALYSALNVSFSNVEATGLRYLITVSTDGWRKKQGSHLAQPDVNKPWVLEAACIVALSLLRADDKVTVSTFIATEGLNARPVHIDKNATFQEAMNRMKSKSTAPPNLGKPILWAAHHRKKYDVFINVVDKMREKYDFTSRAMDLYKKKMNLTNTRLINWVVGSTSTYMEGRNVNNVLTVCGFDVNVPEVIRAFAKHQF